MDGGHLTFAALLAGMLSRWRTGLAVAIGTVLVATALTFVVPPSYRAIASFVTTDAGVQLPRGLSDLALTSGLSGLATQLGIGTGRDPSESPAFYAQLLYSRELLTRLALSRFPDPRGKTADASAALVDILGIRSADRDRAVETAVRRLRRKLRVRFDVRTNMVVLTVDARWPRLSADVANRAVELVSGFNKEQRLSRARARRQFLEERVTAAQAELRATEDSQRLFYERNRSWQNSPGLAGEERRVRRQVETASSLYLSLRQQYEAARLDEVNTTPVITVVDQAVPPKRRQWPQRTLTLLAAAFLGTVFGVLWAATRTLFSHWAQRYPDEALLLSGTVTRVAHEVGRALPRRRSVAAGDPAP